MGQTILLILPTLGETTVFYLITCLIRIFCYIPLFYLGSFAGSSLLAQQYPYGYLYRCFKSNEKLQKFNILKRTMIKMNDEY